MFVAAHGGGRRTRPRGPVPELSLGAAAPALEATRRPERAAVARAHRDRGSELLDRRAHRRGRAQPRPGAELAVSAAPPAPDDPVARDRAAVLAPLADRGGRHRDARGPGDPAHHGADLRGALASPSDEPERIHIGHLGSRAAPRDRTAHDLPPLAVPRHHVQADHLAHGDPEHGRVERDGRDHAAARWSQTAFTGREEESDEREALPERRASSPERSSHASRPRSRSIPGGAHPRRSARFLV